MNTRYSITADIRKEIGHQAKRSRKNGLIPGTMYGGSSESVTLTVPYDEFLVVYKKAGETHLVDLSINGKTHPVLIHTVQIHPVTTAILHVEFLIVNLTEKMQTHVPVRLIGDSPAVAEGIGTLITTLQEVEIECLPSNIPEGLDVDISLLKEVNQEIKVSQLVTPKDVVILADPEITVVKVGAIVVEAVVAPPETEAPAGEAAPAEGDASKAEETPAKTE